MIKRMSESWNQGKLQNAEDTAKLCVSPKPRIASERTNEDLNRLELKMVKTTKQVLALLVILGAAGVVWQATRSLRAQSDGGETQASDNDRSSGDFKPRRVLKAQPAITRPKTLAADQVKGQVTDEELVIGLELNGQARAYPINMLTGPRREIINDTIGGTPIAATW